MRNRVRAMFLIFSITFLAFMPKVFSEENTKFNVVLIVIDALRADHLGCYGYQRDTSPNIDKLAKEGIIFRRAFSQGASTEVSMASILTSLYPGVHRVLEWEAVLPEKLVTWPEILSKNRYQTVAFQSEHVSDILGLGRSFGLLVSGKSKPRQEWLKPPALQITGQAIDLLKGNLRRPFFLYLHYFDVHYPYIAQPPYDKIFWHDQITKEMKQLISNFARRSHGEFTALPEQQLDFVVSQYDGNIKCVDDQVARFLDELEREGVSKNTLVILTADHGEGFFDHGRFFHSNSLYDELTHVPLIMKLPENFPRNKAVDNLVRHVDILPTVMDVLSIRQNNFMQGKSLLPLLRGQAEYKADSFAESWKGYTKGVRTDKWKLIENYNPDIKLYYYELYDLEKDPKELNNLINDDPQEAEALKKELNDYTLSCDQARKKLLGQNFKQKYLPAEGKRKEILKNLNYLQ